MTRHPVDLLSFISGLLVLVAGLVLLSGRLDQVPMEWLGPVAAIGLGVVIAVAARPSRSAPLSVESVEVGTGSASEAGSAQRS